MAHEVESMFSVRKVPWHGLGTILDSPPTSEEAIKEAGLDWQVLQRAVYWQSPLNPDKYIEIPDRKLLVRDNDETALGLVSKDYTPLQNSTAFSFFDPLVSEGFAEYETAGSLKDGRKIWVLARIKGDFQIGDGDYIRKYVLLCNGHDGGTGILVQPTPVRVVCNNTLMCSLSQGMVHRMTHRGNLSEKIKDAAELIGFTAERFTRLKLMFERMNAHVLTPLQRLGYVTALIPDAPENATDRIKGRIADQRDGVLQLAEQGMSKDLRTFNPNTLWTLYNAAVEFADWYMGSRSADLGNYQLFGLGALYKQRAMALAEAILAGIDPHSLTQPTGIDSETASRVEID